jgi:hypothetical protein
MNSTAAGLHPIFEAIVTSFADAPAIVRKAAYITALQQHDWTFEFSDDRRVVLRGREQLKHLQAEQRAIDLDFAVWNERCPVEFRCGE